MREEVTQTQTGRHRRSKKYKTLKDVLSFCLCPLSTNMMRLTAVQTKVSATSTCVSLRMFTVHLHYLTAVLFIPSTSTAELRGSWKGGWTVKEPETYFCVGRQSSGTHCCSVGENPDSIHGLFTFSRPLPLAVSHVCLHGSDCKQGTRMLFIHKRAHEREMSLWSLNIDPLGAY